MCVDLDRPGADAEGVSDLDLTKVGVVAKDEHLPLAGRQLPYRSEDALAPQPIQGTRLGAGPHRAPRGICAAGLRTRFALNHLLVTLSRAGPR